MTKRKQIEIQWFCNIAQRFFSKHGTAFNQFAKNCVSQHRDESAKNFPEKTKIEYYHNFIDWSITWCDTPEGSKFWGNIDSEFREFCDKEYKLFLVKIYWWQRYESKLQKTSR